VDAYLLDTTILSAYLDPSHKFHSERCRAVDSLPPESPRFISVVGLAELTFGADLAAALGKGDAPALREMIRQAHNYAVLHVTHHTAAAYSDLKSRLARKYLAKPLRRDRPKYVEDWVDKTTGRALGVDENDVWMAAQAKERGLVLVTADGRMKRIEDADPDVRLLIV
jgi:predicted nucleic acid-binding protein